jgi:hypothetical protein
VVPRHRVARARCWLSAPSFAHPQGARRCSWAFPACDSTRGSSPDHLHSWPSGWLASPVRSPVKGRARLLDGIRVNFNYSISPKEPRRSRMPGSVKHQWSHGLWLVLRRSARSDGSHARRILRPEAALPRSGIPTNPAASTRTMFRQVEEPGCSTESGQTITTREARKNRGARPFRGRTGALGTRAFPWPHLRRGKFEVPTSGRWGLRRVPCSFTEWG